MCDDPRLSLSFRRSLADHEPRFSSRFVSLRPEALKRPWSYNVNVTDAMEHTGKQDATASAVTRERVSRSAKIEGKSTPIAIRSIAAAVVMLATWLPTAFAQPQASTTIRGTVQDAAGTPVSGASVRLEHEGARPVEMKANSDGSFAFPELAPGAY